MRGSVLPTIARGQAKSGKSGGDQRNRQATREMAFSMRHCNPDSRTFVLLLALPATVGARDLGSFLADKDGVVQELEQSIRRRMTGTDRARRERVVTSA